MNYSEIKPDSDILIVGSENPQFVASGVPIKVLSKSPPYVFCVDPWDKYFSIDIREVSLVFADPHYVETFLKEMPKFKKKDSEEKANKEKVCPVCQADMRNTRKGDDWFLVCDTCTFMGKIE